MRRDYAQRMRYENLRKESEKELEKDLASLLKFKSLCVFLPTPFFPFLSIRPSPRNMRNASVLRGDCCRRLASISDLTAPLAPLIRLKSDAESQSIVTAPNAFLTLGAFALLQTT